MKITNFRNRRATNEGTSRQVWFADVTVKEWFKPERTEVVFREHFSTYWKWLKDGSLTPGNHVEEFDRAFGAKQDFETLK